MGNETKFEQHLKFRRGENGFDYPGHELKLSSSSFRAHRKHKLVSSLISADKGEAINKCGVRKNDKRELTGRTRKNTVTSNRKKSTKTSRDGSAAAIDDVKLFMESLLEDLKVGRENLFVRMKEEMRKLMADDADIHSGKKEIGNGRKSVQFQVDDVDNFEENIELHDQSDFDENNQFHHQKGVRKTNLVQHQNSFEEEIAMQHQNNLKVQNAKVRNMKDFKENVYVQAQNNLKSEIRTQTSSDGSLMRSVESNEESGLDNYYQTLEDLDVYAQATRGESLALQVRPNAQYYPANHSAQMHHQKNFLSGRKSENRNDGTLVNLMEGKRTPNPYLHQVLEYQGTYDQEVESITSSLKEKGEDQVASAMDLTVPTALTGQHCLENHTLDIFSCNFIQPTVAGNRKGINFGGENHCGYFSGVQMEEPKRSFVRLCSGNVGSFVQRSTPNSIIGNEFPASLHQGMDTGFLIPRNQFIFDRERNNVSGLKMDGGAMNFSGGIYDLSEH